MVEAVRLAVAALGALLLVEVAGGCGGSDAGDPSSLEGIPWVLSSGVEVTGWETVAPSILFEDGRFSGSSGCNRYGGSYTVEGDILELGEIASTRMACPPPGDAVERTYLGTLRGTAGWSTEDDELVLSDVEDVELLRFTVGTPVGAWQVTSFLRGDAVTSPIAGTEITASFDDEGQLSGSAGCNTYTSAYTTDAGSITIEAPATTRKLCPEPAGVMEQETAYLAALGEAERFSVGGGSLTLLRADGTIAVALSAAD